MLGDLVVQVLTSSGLATDWGVQADFVSYISRQTRSQLSVLLEGRGYFELAQGPVVLAPGDIVHTDQGLHAAEGYAGSPCTVMILEWGYSSFAVPWQGQARRSRIPRTDVLALNRLVARINVTPQLLSIPRLRLADVARLSGFRSAAALSRAFTMRGPTTPGNIARRLAQVWT